MLYCKNSFVHSIGFLVGDKSFAFFVYANFLPVYSVYTMGFPSSLLSFVNIYLLGSSIKKKKKVLIKKHVVSSQKM